MSILCETDSSCNAKCQYYVKLILPVIQNVKILLKLIPPEIQNVKILLKLILPEIQNAVETDSS